MRKSLTFLWAVHLLHIGWLSDHLLNMCCQPRFKTPLLRGEPSSRLDQFKKIEADVSSDLDHWLCNLYFQVCAYVCIWEANMCMFLLKICLMFIVFKFTIICRYLRAQTCTQNHICSPSLILSHYLGCLECGMVNGFYLGCLECRMMDLRRLGLDIWIFCDDKKLVQINWKLAPESRQEPHLCPTIPDAFELMHWLN